MPEFQIPDWAEGWVYFADWQDLGVAIIGILLVTLLIIWWRQQTRQWFRIVTGTMLIALILCISSYYLFVVPVHFASCPAGCPGWRGFPLPVARVSLDGTSQIGILDFLLNLLLLWLLWLGASLVWRLLGLWAEWWKRSWRFKFTFIFFLVILPWALLPRIINPPQPSATDEDLRLAVNARRSAEFTYRITGIWVQRLALQDIRRTETSAAVTDAFGQVESNQVCLRGYTYFYLPWRDYRITLDASGVTALSLAELSLEEPCWNDQ